MPEELNKEMKALRRDVQTLLDKQEIYEVLCRYCRAIDRHDEDLMRSVYHPDALDHHGMFDGKASDFCEFFMRREVRGGLKGASHRITNVLIELKGDVAHSECYYHAYIRSENEGQDYLYLVDGRYLDRFERRNGVWKIAERYCVFDWNMFTPYTEDWNRLGAPLVMGGRTVGEDPLYTVWSERPKWSSLLERPSKEI